MFSKPINISLAIFTTSHFRKTKVFFLLRNTDRLIFRGDSTNLWIRIDQDSVLYFLKGHEILNIRCGAVSGKSRLV